MAADQQQITTLQQENARLRQRLVELAQREAHFREFVEGTDDMITQVDHNGIFTYVNETTARLLGLPRAECLGRSAFDFIHPDDQAMTRQAFMGWVQNRERSVSFENRQISIHGDVYPMLWTINLHYDSSGNLAYINSICRNTSQIKGLEAELHQAHAELEQRTTAQTTALRQNQEMLQLVIDSLPEAVFWKDRNLIYRGCNQTFATFAGVGTPAEIVGKSDYDLPWKTEEATSYREYDQRIMQSGTPEYHIIETQQHADGKQSWADTNKVPLRDAQGTVIGILGTYEDITERKQQEEELRLTRFALDRAADIVLWHYLDGRTIYANEAACHKLGYDREELLTLTIPDLDPNFTLESAQQLWKTIEMHGFATIETTHRRKDGTIYPAEVTINALQYGDQTFLCVFARDITERKQQETTLRMFEALVENALDAIGIAGIDHHITYANAAFQQVSGYGADLIGKQLLELYTPESRMLLEQKALPELLRTGVWQGDLDMQRPDGSRWTAQQSAFLVKDNIGQVVGMANVMRDLTRQKQAEAEREALQQQIIDAQRNALRELSTPLIPISDNVVIMPLIGTIDSRRAQQVMETLLEGVARYQADLVILDITGVLVVDTQVAQAFIQVARAVKLLGAQVMLTGIQPQIAHTLVTLGAELSDIQTRGSLQAGIAAALGGRF